MIFIGLGSKVVEAFALSDTSSSLQYRNFYHTQRRRQYLFSSKLTFFLVSLLPDSLAYRMTPKLIEKMWLESSQALADGKAGQHTSAAPIKIILKETN